MLQSKRHSSNKQRTTDCLMKNFYWIMIAAYLVDLFFIRIPISAVCAILILIITAIFLYKRRGMIPIKPVSFYFIWMLLSCGLCVLNKLPLVLFVQGVAYTAVPVLLYFVPKKDPEGITSHYIAALFASIIIAYVLFAWAPGFYGEYLVYHGHLGRPDKAWIQSALNGLYGITMLSSFAAICSI